MRPNADVLESRCFQDAADVVGVGEAERALIDQCVEARRGEWQVV